MLLHIKPAQNQTKNNHPPFNINKVSTIPKKKMIPRYLLHSNLNPELLQNTPAKQEEKKNIYSRENFINFEARKPSTLFNTSGL